MFGQVHECSFIRNYGPIMDVYMELSKKHKELEIAEEKAILKAFSSKKYKNNQNATASLRRRYDSYV
jgi:hypothetical protein